MTKDDKLCCKLLEQQLLAMEQILKSIKDITSEFNRRDINSSKLERDIVDIFEQLEKIEETDDE